jgi:chromosome segregation ATPase
MSSQLNRIEEKIDKLDGRLDAVEVNMAVYNEQLKIHIEGVQLARAEIRPIKKDWQKAKAVLWFLGWGTSAFTAGGGAILLAKSLGLF